MKIEEGFVPFEGYRTWYRRVGESKEGKLPLLVLHGGAGSAHDYLEFLDGIAAFGREVIYYDQLGCGKSSLDEPRPDLWTAELFEREIDVVRQALGLKELHILGHSWGGMLAMQYAIHGTEGVRSMVVASSPPSMALWEEETHRLIDLLPEEHRRAILQSEATGDYDNPAYKEAEKVYGYRHVDSLDPKPHCMRAQEGEVYYVMNGPSEFTITGKMKDWDITEELGKITLPVLLTSGTDDEATPLMVKTIYDRLPDVRWELLKGTHAVHAERPEEYNRIVEDFIKEFD